MDLSKVMAISGKSGLFRIVSQSRGSVIVESMTDGKKMPVFATHRSSVLEDISMFTEAEDIPLKDVLWKMHQKEDGKPVSADPKSDQETLKAWFEEVLPDYDRERVYPSDIKKVIAWYNLLLENEMISEPVKKEEKEAEEKEEKAEVETAAADKEVEEEKPVNPKKKEDKSN